MSYTPEYIAWAGMKARCTNSSLASFVHYGGRGITVCDEWMESFAVFSEDMGKRPGPAYSLDRIDVNGNYEPGNVRWATAKEQANNRRRSPAVIPRLRAGKVPTLEPLNDAAKLAKISRRTLQKWLSEGRLTRWQLPGDRRRFVDVGELQPVPRL